MALKTILIWSFVLGDLFLLIWLIDFVGFKNTGLFTAFYMISIILSTIILGLLGLLNPVKWELEYQRTLYNKYKSLKMIGIVILLVGGILFTSIIDARIMGLIIGFLVVLYMGLFTQELLFSISQIVKVLEDAARKRYKWLK